MTQKGLKPVIEKDEAVSPIIATILLVAITVILASTLYLALGGFFKTGTTSTPTVGLSATNTTVKPIAVAATAYDTSGSFTYTISIGSVSSSTISWASTDWIVTLAGGVTVTIGNYTTSGGWVVTAGAAGTTLNGFSVSAPGTTYVGAGSLTFTITPPTTNTASGYSIPNPVSIQFMDTSSTGGGQMGTTSL